MKKPKNDIEFCEKISTLEGEVQMLEENLNYNRNPFQRKEIQSLLYEKRKQLSKAQVQYDSYIIRHNSI